MDKINPIEVFGKKAILEMFSERVEYMKTLPPIEDTASPYMEKLLSFRETGGKKWVIKWLKFRLAEALYDKEEACARWRESLLLSAKGKYPESVEVVSIFMKEDLERHDRGIAKRRAVLRALSGKKSSFGENEIFAAREIPMDEIVEELPRNRMVLCPFHEEKTASCRIYKDHFYCFGCQKRGDGIDWVMKQRDMKFKEAVLFIIKK